MSNIHQIKRLSIRDYLSRRGIRPARENDRCGFYLSPLRAEHTPSFKVDYTLNLWHDFGTGKGGSIIDLVMGLENCDKAQAIRLLDRAEISPVVVAPASATPTTPALRILANTPLQHAALIGYLRERGINPAIAAAYCRQVRYAVGGREFFAIGFCNDAGAWELRSEHFKGGSSPKHITTIDNHADTCIAFEGFMDFLSYLTLKKVELGCERRQSNPAPATASDCAYFLRQRRRRTQGDCPSTAACTSRRGGRSVSTLP